MNQYVSDPLEAISTAVGAFLVLVGLTTLIGMPWASKSGSLVLALGQILGAVAAIAVGVGLTWLVRTQK